MSRAASLLLERGLLVRQVAELVGFDDPYHFSKAFKRVYGTSPEAFRERGGRGPQRGRPAYRPPRRSAASGPCAALGRCPAAQRAASIRRPQVRLRLCAPVAAVELQEDGRVREGQRGLQQENADVRPASSSARMMSSCGSARVSTAARAATTPSRSAPMPAHGPRRRTPAPRRGERSPARAGRARSRRRRPPAPRGDRRPSRPSRCRARLPRVGRVRDDDAVAVAEEGQRAARARHASREAAGAGPWWPGRAASLGAQARSPEPVQRPAPVGLESAAAARRVSLAADRPALRREQRSQPLPLVALDLDRLLGRVPPVPQAFFSSAASAARNDGLRGRSATTVTLLPPRPFFSSRSTQATFAGTGSSPPGAAAVVRGPPALRAEASAAGLVDGPRVARAHEALLSCRVMAAAYDANEARVNADAACAAVRDDARPRPERTTRAAGCGEPRLNEGTRRRARERTRRAPATRSRRGSG